MEGGLVQDVRGLPIGTTVRVVDLDIEGSDLEDTKPLTGDDVPPWIKEVQGALPKRGRITQRGFISDFTAKGRVAKRVPCKHLTGYWINKAMRNFRCYECQCQFHIGDNLPADHPTKGIEVWRGN
jgi:hypothetical protein